MSHIESKLWTEELFAVLEETFTIHHGIYLDPDTSLFTTLESITSDEASLPVGGKCASLAAQVTHVNFYLEVLEKYIHSENPGNVDWGEIWRTVESVSPTEWEGLVDQLKVTYDRIWRDLHKIEDWNDSNRIGGCLAIVVHTAYHLGEIRQATCTLR